MEVDKMSLFFLKLIAIVLMLLDHIGYVFGIDGWNIINLESWQFLRGIGRIAFPIFAYCIVNGLQKTRNIEKYIARMFLFAVISQIPFTLALYIVNLMPITSDESLYYFSFNKYGIVAVGLVLLGYLMIEKKLSKKIFFVFALAVMASGISLKIAGIWITYAGNLNVFYTLTLGLVIISGIQRYYKDYKIQAKQKVVLCIMMLLVVFYIASRADYGIAGVVLIVGLYFAREKKQWIILTVCLWGVIFYGMVYENWYNAMFACIASGLICLYNGKKGMSVKYLFYLFYPVHLFALGMINILLRFKIMDYSHL